MLYSGELRELISNSWDYILYLWIGLDTIKSTRAPAIQMGMIIAQCLIEFNKNLDLYLFGVGAPHVLLVGCKIGGVNPSVGGLFYSSIPLYFIDTF